jgi:hypothetical protein
MFSAFPRTQIVLSISICNYVSTDCIDQNSNKQSDGQYVTLTLLQAAAHAKARAAQRAPRFNAGAGGGGGGPQTCRDFQKGQCSRGDKCRFAHVLTR